MRHQHIEEYSEEHSEEHSHQMISTPEERLNKPEVLKGLTVSEEEAVECYVTIRNLNVIKQNKIDIKNDSHATLFKSQIIIQKKNKS